MSNMISRGIMVGKGVIFKTDDGRLFIVDGVLNIDIATSRADIKAMALTKNYGEYVRMKITAAELRKYVSNITEQDRDKLNLLGIHIDT